MGSPVRCTPRLLLRALRTQRDANRLNQIVRLLYSLPITNFASVLNQRVELAICHNFCLYPASERAYSVFLQHTFDDWVI